MRIIPTLLWALIISTGFFTGGTGAERGTPDYRGRAGEVPAEGAQDAVYLDRRISMLETRLSSIESSLRNVQQQAMASERSTATQPARDPEVMLLRSEVEILNSRLRELECALVRLDERTLSPAAREARKRTAAQPADPCRVNPDTPIQLSPRR
jgi:chromosome segregation ATPase